MKTLVFPKWIPGEHSPSGPINTMIKFSVASGGKPVKWTRDPLDMYRFNCDIPKDSSSLDVDLVFGLQPETVATAKLARIVWNQMLVYPGEADASSYQVQASLKVPGGWRVATALPIASSSPEETRFQTVSLESLVDSPCITGQFLETVNITSDIETPHILAVASDRPDDISLDNDTILGYRRLVQEAWALFGDRGYRQYQWLVTLSDYGAEAGLEHHESSEDGVKSNGLTDPAGQRSLAELLAHEYVHSWNGKYRRPAGLLGKNYQDPMQTELLWMYEGLTQFLGTVLPTRAGQWDPQYFREVIASYCASMDHQQGRSWRPLADTATSAQLLYGAPSIWASARRGPDFYVEMVLNWIEVDMIIQRSSNGTKSIDDFCKAFFSGLNGVPQVKAYELAGILSALSSVASYDWRGWLDHKIYTAMPGANLAGVEASGWSLTYNETPNMYEEDMSQLYGSSGALYSLGFTASDGKIEDVVPGMPAAQAGVAPAMKLVSVNGESYSVSVLNRAIVRSKQTGRVDLVVERAGFLKNLVIQYSGGPLFPHLVPIEGKPDLLSALIMPRVARGR